MFCFIIVVAPKELINFYQLFWSNKQVHFIVIYECGRIVIFELTHTFTHTFLLFFTERACRQLAKANLGGHA